MADLLPAAGLERKIFLIRGLRVMLDRDLAGLYGVTTGNLNKAVSRNLERFPADFMFQLGPDEYRALRFQIGILETGRHSKFLPRVFTEQGVAMLSSVLRSARAIEVNIAVMRAFVRLRQALLDHRGLAKRLAAVERRILEQETALGEHVEEVREVFKAIRRLMVDRRPPSRKIGFKP